jgi:hypothetical protein
MPEEKDHQSSQPPREAESEPPREAASEDALSDISRRLAELAEQAKKLAAQPLKEA